MELNFTELYIGQVFSNRRTISRSKEIQTGSTKSDPPQPVFSTVYATVVVNSRYMQSRAVLECRIYDQPTGNNLMYDRFPGNDDWRFETASYTGDRRALTTEDLLLISNSSMAVPPSRADVANRLVQNCYNLLLSRIKTGVKFGY